MVATVRCVGGIVFDSSGRLLLVRRGHAPGKGLWSLPGGRVETGENDTEAVMRELREETGLAVRPLTLAGTLTRGQYEIHDYTCIVEGGQLRPGDDADDVKWVDSAEFTALDKAGHPPKELGEKLRLWNAIPRR